MDELATLVRRVQAGDQEAYAEIVCRLQDMAVGYSYAILGDYYWAQDAAQEAFIEAYRDIAKLREPLRDAEVDQTGPQSHFDLAIVPLDGSTQHAIASWIPQAYGNYFD